MDSAGRYARQTMLPGFGADGQLRLSQARVLVVGAGGLGAPVLTYLAASGVGHIAVVDGDIVTESNLARQVLYRRGDLGADKATTAARWLAGLNPSIEIDPRVERLEGPRGARFVRNYSVVVDSSDNFDTRYFLNDAALSADIPYVWGAVSNYAGRAGVAMKGRGPCFRCLFPQDRARAGEGAPVGARSSPADRTQSPIDVAGSPTGVLGPICAVIGGWMAGEVLAMLAGVRAPAATTLVQMDLEHAVAQALTVAADPECPTCSSSSRAGFR